MLLGCNYIDIRAQKHWDGLAFQYLLQAMYVENDNLFLSNKN